MEENGLNQINEQLRKYKNYLQNILGYSQKTIITYLFYVRELANYNFDYTALMNSKQNITNNTKRVALSAIKNFYTYNDDEQAYKITLPKKDKKIMPHISFEEYIAILEKLKTINVKTLIVRMLFETGIRSSELLSISVNDIEDQKIIINGKGQKQRIVYISENLSKVIILFIKNNHLQSHDKIVDFSYRNLYKHIQKIGLKINKYLTPHMFRRGFATHCMNKGVGIYEISLMMGHENINTTKMYLRNESKIEIMKTLF